MTVVAGDEREDAAASAGRDAKLALVEASLILGLKLETEGDLEAAATAYRRADRQGDAEAAFRLGLLLEAQGKFDAAKAAYRRADRRDHGEAARRRGMLLAARGEMPGAEAAFRRAAQRSATSTPHAVPALNAEEAGAGPGTGVSPKRRAHRVSMSRGMLMLGLPPYLAVMVLLGGAIAGHKGSSRHTLGRIHPGPASAIAALPALLPGARRPQPAVTHAPPAGRHPSRRAQRPGRHAPRRVEVHSATPRARSVRAASPVSAARQPASTVSPLTQVFRVRPTPRTEVGAGAPTVRHEAPARRNPGGTGTLSGGG